MGAKLRFDRKSLVRAAIAGLFFVLGSTSPRAQVGGDAVGGTLQRLLQGSGEQLGFSPSGGTDQFSSPVQIYQPVLPQTIQTAPPSRLEALYSSRAGRPLTQFGYDVLGVPTAVTAAQVGGVQDNYVLGEGDEIIVDLRGQESASYRQRVNRNGQIVLPKLAPIPAVGRTLSDFRSDLERQVGQAYISSNVFVSVGQIRQVSVLVTGEARSPGTRILSGLATPLDAILLSGGIAKTGSLRNVALIRGNQTIPIDLYGLLLQGVLPNIGGLRNGDRIYIPPLHNTVAVAGYVRRPGIYELRDGQPSLEVNDLVQLAGGTEIAGSYRLSKFSLESDGSTRLVSFTRGPVANGEVLFVDSAIDVALERVELAGSVRLAGTFPRTVSPSVAKLVRSVDELLPDAYTAFGVIARRDPKLNVRSLVPISFAQILSGKDVALQNDDLVYVFNRSQIRLLANVAAAQQTIRLRFGSPNGATLLGTGTFNPGYTTPPNAPPPGLGTPGNPLNAPNALYPANVANPSNNASNNSNQDKALYRDAGNPFAAGASYPSGYPYGSGYPGAPGFACTGYPYASGYSYGNGYPYGAVASPYGAPLAPQTYSASGAPFGAAAPYGTMPLQYGNQASPFLPPAAAAYGFPGAPAGLPPGLGQSQAGASQQQSPNGVSVNPQNGVPNGFGTGLPLCPNYQQLQIPGAPQVQPLAPEGIAFILGVPVEALLRMTADHTVWILDEVRDPGAYVASDGATLGEMIQTAGGILRQADLSSVEVTSTEINPQSGTSRTIRTAYKGEVGDFQRVSLRPLDVIRLRPVFSDREEGRVTIVGQVRYPGTFDINRGEHLSSVLERAGGVTETAYPYGAVFTRERAAIAEREGHAREAREINAQIAGLASSPNSNDRDKVTFLTSLGQQVQNEPALGRITVTADPAILRVHPELDIILEPGDALVIPPRPATVTVTGEVLNPGSFQYKAGLDVREYIDLAGGVTQGADDGRIFVVLPDGTARPIQESWLSFTNANSAPPGSTIVIPRDLRPFDLSVFLRDATQITSQLAVTAASLAIIGR